MGRDQAGFDRISEEVQVLGQDQIGGGTDVSVV